MTGFNASLWYQINVKIASAQSMVATPLYDHGRGSVFFQTTNASAPEQNWQIFPFNSSVYVFRARNIGVTGYLTTFPGGNHDNDQTECRPRIANFNLTDDSMFWYIESWGDDTFYLTNAANGTAWHMAMESDFLTVMASDISVQQNAQSFSFIPIGTMDDVRFSSIIIPGGTTFSLPSSTSSLPPGTSSSMFFETADSSSSATFPALATASTSTSSSSTFPSVLDTSTFSSSTLLSTLSASTPSLSTSFSILPTTTSSLTTIPSSTSTSTFSSSSLATSDQIALGVGLGVGLPTVIIGLLALWLQRYRRDKH